MFYITGNTHANFQQFNLPICKKMKKDDILFVCGDFGFVWDGSEEEKKILDKLSQKKFTIAFVDGTHENFDLLNSYPVEEFFGGKVHRISANIVHLMRGEVFNIDGTTFFAFGGGESSSMDKEMRIESNNWWQEELPDMDCINQADANLDKISHTVDYIITHEPPITFNKLLMGYSDIINPFYMYLEKLNKTVKYKKWFFGALHIDRKITSKVYSLFNDIVCIDAPNKDSKGNHFKKKGRKLSNVFSKK